MDADREVSRLSRYTLLASLSPTGVPLPMSTATRSSADTIDVFDKYVIPNYRRYPVCLVRGEGSLRLGRGGEPLPRLVPRLGLQHPRLLPAAGRAGDSGAGRRADPRPEHLVHRAAGRVRRGALHAQASARRSSATAAPRRTRGRSSWPGCTRQRASTRSSRSTNGFHGRTLRRRDGDRPAEVPRRDRPAAAGLPVCARTTTSTPSAS